MKTIKLIVLTFTISLNTAFAKENNAKKITSNAAYPSLELPLIKVVPIKDTKTDRNYELYIKLPKDYS